MQAVRNLVQGVRAIMSDNLNLNCRCEQSLSTSVGDLFIACTFDVLLSDSRGAGQSLLTFLRLSLLDQCFAIGNVDMPRARL